MVGKQLVHPKYGILSVEPNEEEKANPAESVMAQLQRNFGFLEASDRQDYNPIGFCQTYRDPDGNPVNVNVQQDAQEFLNFFMDKVEHRLKHTPQETLLDRVFSFSMASQLRSKLVADMQGQLDLYLKSTRCAGEGQKHPARIWHVKEVLRSRGWVAFW